jgi:diguanylate cyclase (GGDEF)-like protein
MHEEKSLGQITMSIGLALFPNHADSCQDLILKADKALYSAKARGRNCTVVAQASSQSYKQES